MAEILDLVDVDRLRKEVQTKYREVADEPGGPDQQRVINLCPDKLGVCREIARMLRPGGRMMIADICIDKPIPESARRDIDLWTG